MAELQRPRGRQVDEIVAAARWIEATWSPNHTAPEVAPHLTCRELNALAALFTSVGLVELAGQLVKSHEENDEEGDLHFTGGDS